jgi:hypothetical protein
MISNPPHLQKSNAQVAVKTHSYFHIWEVSTESHDIVGSLWTYLLFRKNYAFL